MPQLWVGMLALLLTSLLLSACGSGNATQAHANKAKLDQELTHARTALGIPDRLLQPVTAQEQKVAAGEGGLFYNYDAAAKNYALLYTQLLGVEQTAQQTLQAQAQADMQAFAAALDERRAEGFVEIPVYQSRFDEAQQAFDQAKTPTDFAHVSELASAQTQALQAMWPAYQKLQELQAVIKSLRDAGISVQLAQQLYDQDLAVFRDAASADRYQALTGVIDAQIMQALADGTAAQPYVAKTLLAEMQASVGDLRTWGDTANASAFQQQYDADAERLAAASQLTDYLSLAQVIQRQDTAMALPLIKAKAEYNLGVLQQLVDTAQTYAVVNPADGREYAIAPEYADRSVGVGDASNRLNAAHTLAQYQAADFEIESLVACLRAQLEERDLSHPHNAVPQDTAPSDAHATDLELLRYFNVTNGRVVLVSLAEQAARFYENGKLVNWTSVTTGAPRLPSVPGWHVAIYRASPTLFISPDPPGSPDYYAPTPVHYAVAYNTGGYFLHDAWWRHRFGLYTNLPHHDPAAFNGGSHGCINIPFQTTVGAPMQWVYTWIGAGTPIIVY